MSDVFCKIIAGEIPSAKIYEDDRALVILDITQTTKGHALVMPKKHCTSILDCQKEDLAYLIEVAQKVAKAAMAAFGAKGCNILTNAGEAAGQSVPHFHIHVVPRYDEKDGLLLETRPSGIAMEELPALAKKIQEKL